MKLTSENNSADVRVLIENSKGLWFYETLKRHVVAQHFSPSTGETFLELHTSDESDFLEWQIKHPDAIRFPAS